MNNNRLLQPYPLGITEFDNNIKFSFAGGNAGQCTLHIFKKGSENPFISIDMDTHNKTGDVFSCLVDKSVFNKRPDACYEYIYEINGRNYTDPYAPQISGRNVFGRLPGSVRGQIRFDRNTVNCVSRPVYDAHELIIYQMHIRGFTRHRSSKVKHRGTYSGITEKADHLKQLGINCVLLLPAYEYNEIISEPAPVGLPDYIEYEDTHRVNYWGYTTDAFYMAPKASYSSSPDHAADEFSNMVATLHNNGIMVLMDMHFPSWAHSGYVCDCIRNWVINYQIDGFRVNQDVIDTSLLTRDPVLSGIILLGNYWNNQYNALPAGTSDLIPSSGCRLVHCNDGFLVKIRQFIRGDINNVWELFDKLVEGDYHYHDIESVNYVATVNGFTLNDSVSYIMKHNEDNNENNRDGTDYNYSVNYGVEGKTRRKKINEQRVRTIRNELMLLMISSGIPMLLAGDEMYNSQNGNNNAYCQDNDISWLNWSKAAKDPSLIQYIRTLTAFRKDYITGNKRGYTRLTINNHATIPNISYHGREPWSTVQCSTNRAGGVLISDKGLYIAVNLQDYAYSFELPVLEDSCIWKASCWSSPNPPKGFIVEPDSIAVFTREPEQ